MGGDSLVGLGPGAFAVVSGLWRAAEEWPVLFASAVTRQPSALSAAERQQIEQGITHRRTQLALQRKAVESEIGASREQARKQLEDGKERLARENSIAGNRARQQRQEFGRRTATLQQNNSLHGTLSASLEAAKLRHRGLSYLSYLRFLYTGR